MMYYFRFVVVNVMFVKHTSTITQPICMYIFGKHEKKDEPDRELINCYNINTP